MSSSRNYRKMCLGNWRMGFVFPCVVVTFVCWYLLSVWVIRPWNFRSLLVMVIPSYCNELCNSGKGTMRNAVTDPCTWVWFKSRVWLHCHICFLNFCFPMAKLQNLKNCAKTWKFGYLYKRRWCAIGSLKTENIVIKILLTLP